MAKVNKTDLEKEIEESMRAGADWLENELKALYAEESLLVAGLDKAFPTILDEESQREHKVCRYARTTMEGEHTHIWAAPASTRSQLKYEPQEESMFAEMDRFLQYSVAVMPYREVRPMKEIKPWDVATIRTYERALLEKLPQPIVLVNPAVSTIWATENMKVKILVSDRWEAYVRDEYHKQGKNPDWYNETTDHRYVHFLGTNGKHNCPEGVRWVALTPNPVNLPVYYDDCDSSRTETGWNVRYKRQQVWSYEIPDQPLHNRMNPKSVDHYLSHTGQAFFLEGNIRFDQPRDITHYPGSYYLAGPVPPEVNGYRENDHTVWDVPGSGTWFSRRKAIREYAESKGKRPATVMDSGNIQVSMFTETLTETTEYYYKWGVSVFEVTSRVDRARGSKSGIGVYVSRNPQHIMVPNCPGLFYVMLPIYPGEKEIVRLDHQVYVCRSWSEFQNRLPAVIAYFTPSRTSYRHHRELAPSGWDGVADIAHQAAEGRMRVSEAVMKFSVTLDTLVTWIKYSPAHVLLNPWMAHFENFYDWKLEDNYNYTLQFPPVPLMDYFICRKDELFQPGVYESRDPAVLERFELPFRAVGVLMSGTTGNYKRIT